ncbi:MAG: glycoside hydrolase family 88 protein, partial [Tannerellaceae bacterium]
MKLRKIKEKLIIATVIMSATSNIEAQNDEHSFIRENMEFAAKQCKLMMKTPAQGKEGKSVMPHSMRKDGTPSKGSIYLWTAGFFPGTLWYLSDYTNDKELQDSALVYTKKMEPVKTFTDNHDIGFMMYCSYGNANIFAPKADYNDILIKSAHSLCTRYSPVTGTIKSWNSWRSWNDGTVFNYPVIIDNMMNLELLFFASRVSGNDSFRNVAVSHAEKTMKNQMRKDGSFYHITMYDPDNGKFIKGETSQGYSDNSAWSRGQGWAIYGFTVSYRETKDPRFLATAQKAADYYINHPNLPSDKIAWWDFNAFEDGFTPGP